MLPNKFENEALSLEEIYSELHATADSIEHGRTVTRPISAQEIITNQRELAKVTKRLDQMNREINKIKEEFGEKELKATRTELIAELSNSEETSQQEVFIFKDFSTNIANEYNKNGDWIGSRPLKSDERQTTIMSKISH